MRAESAKTFKTTGARHRKDALEEFRADFPAVEPEAIEATLAFMEVAAQRSLSEEHLYGKFQLSRGRFEILMFLKRERTHKLAASKLASLAGVSRATMTQFLDTLERDGLVKRERDLGDRRACLIALTKKGDKLLGEVLPEHFRWLARFVKVLTPVERKTLRTLLEKLRVGMNRLV